ncbi:MULTISPECIES: DUF1415 domain-containing protein [Legionella]|uniref:DUF1415 domain-containing protein n=1 Tax=Legionella resiliens TaxID=2905958 RepID=A0ABS8X558_9GAMM|nr:MULTISPECIES: DUF1415 domain-containing protein [unclassified Legionella]MCE0723628.1 DUF1415 domain-containing protein [Legionella sp. 9fVS26]MCE3532781.1 DUF1415 domain-containing protein [Legionella sp. 8cVS16]
MPKLTDDQIKKQTIAWIRSFIIQFKICPFAEYTVNQETLVIDIVRPKNLEQALEMMMSTMVRMDKDIKIETVLLLFPSSLSDFDNYLDFVSLAEEMLTGSGYEGIYQLATFHPDYCFADVLTTDVSNYTNRSPYPMLHILRESSIEKAIDYYGDTSKIPDYNIETMHKLGLDKILTLLKNLT